MSRPLSATFREAHRLRRLIRDLHAEVERAPRLVKAHQAKVAKQEEALKAAQEALKHLKVELHALEVSMKTSHQNLVKYEKQLGEMATDRESAAKQAEITFTQQTIAKLEEDILSKMMEIEESTARLPKLEADLAKARADFAQFQVDSKERVERMSREIKEAEVTLVSVEKEIPEAIRSDYNRLIKAFGAEALAGLKGDSCDHCHTSVPAQVVNDVNNSVFSLCENCGRALYPL